MESNTARLPAYYRAWRHIVAAYVLYHLASILIGSIPAPTEGVLSRAAWKDPSVQSEFSAWSQRLSRLGMTIGPAELKDAVWELSKTWLRWMRAAMTPFRDYQRYTGTAQSWSMFVAPHRYPSRLHVDIREAEGNWRPLYVARSGEWEWHKAQLDHIRFRSAIFRYAWPQYIVAFKQFAAWLAAEAARDFPAASHIRVRYFKSRSPSPDEVREGRQPTGDFTPEITLALDSYR